MDGTGVEGGLKPLADGAPHTASLDLILRAWQASSDPDVFAALVQAVRPTVARVAMRVLRGHGIFDPHAIEDVASLVFDRLRRLAGGPGRERRLVGFRSSGVTAEPAAAFIRCIARTRALDLARARRRQAQHVFLVANVAGDNRLRSTAMNAAEANARERLAEAIERLEPALRAVVELLLEGRSQAEIARVHGVCPGSVSRARSRAIRRLRELMAD